MISGCKVSVFFMDCKFLGQKIMRYIVFLFVRIRRGPRRFAAHSSSDAGRRCCRKAFVRHARTGLCAGARLIALGVTVRCRGFSVFMPPAPGGMCGDRRTVPDCGEVPSAALRRTAEGCRRRAVPRRYPPTRNRPFGIVPDDDGIRRRSGARSCPEKSRRPLSLPPPAIRLRLSMRRRTVGRRHERPHLPQSFRCRSGGRPPCPSVVARLRVSRAGGRRTDGGSLRAAQACRRRSPDRGLRSRFSVRRR